MLVAWAALAAITMPLAPRSPIAAVALLAYAAAAIALGVAQLAAAARIDHAAPIVVQQRDLGRLARLRARCGLALGLPWWLLWVAPIALVAGGALPAAWIAANLAIGAVGLAREPRDRAAARAPADRLAPGGARSSTRCRDRRSHGRRAS